MHVLHPPATAEYTEARPYVRRDHVHVWLLYLSRPSIMWWSRSRKGTERLAWALHSTLITHQSPALCWSPAREETSRLCIRAGCSTHVHARGWKHALADPWRRYQWLDRCSATKGLYTSGWIWHFYLPLEGWLRQRGFDLFWLCSLLPSILTRITQYLCYYLSAV